MFSTQMSMLASWSSGTGITFGSRPAIFIGATGALAIEEETITIHFFLLLITSIHVSLLHYMTHTYMVSGTFMPAPNAIFFNVITRFRGGGVGGPIRESPSEPPIFICRSVPLQVEEKNILDKIFFFILFIVCERV